MKRTLLAIIMLLPMASFAQEQSIPEPVLKELSRDLADMHQALVKAQTSLTSGSEFVAVEVQSAEIHSTPNPSSAVLARVEAGEPFRVVQRSGDWYQVESDANSSGWLKADAVRPLSSTVPASQSSTERLFAELTDKAARLRDRYRDNEYISISGFTIEISVPPSVSIDFEFKE